MAESFKLYKLIILYMLNKVDFPLTNSQISEFILDQGYTTYFKLQQALSELLSSGFRTCRSAFARPQYFCNRTYDPCSSGRDAGDDAGYDPLSEPF